MKQKLNFLHVLLLCGELTYDKYVKIITKYNLKKQLLSLSEINQHCYIDDDGIIIPSKVNYNDDFEKFLNNFNTLISDIKGFEGIYNKFEKIRLNPNKTNLLSKSIDFNYHKQFKLDELIIQRIINDKFITTLSVKNHGWETILKQFYLKVKSQRYGLMLEKILIDELNIIKNPKNSENGDARTIDGRNCEIKTSYISKNNTYNFNQLRLWENVSYYIFLAVDVKMEIQTQTVDHKFIFLTKDELLHLKDIGLLKINKCHTTGGENPPLKISIRNGSDTFKYILENYSMEEKDIKEILKPMNDEKKNDSMNDKNNITIFR